MCLSIPGQVVEINEGMALVDVRGKPLWFNALTEPGLKQGDFVLTHTGLIIAVISQEEAISIDRDVWEMEKSQSEFDKSKMLVESDV